MGLTLEMEGAQGGHFMEWIKGASSTCITLSLGYHGNAIDGMPLKDTHIDHILCMLQQHIPYMGTINTAIMGHSLDML